VGSAELANFRLGAASALIFHVSRFRGTRGLSDPKEYASVRRLFQEQEKKDKRTSKEDSCPVEYPLPALAFGDETAKDWGKVAAASQGKGIYADIPSAFMREVL
jgi:hypothetical protein